MEEVMQDIKTLLYESFDRRLSADEQKLLDDALKNSEELRNEKAEVEKLRNMLGSFTPEFTADFTDRVINKIESETSGFINIFRYLVMTGIAAIILLLVTIYFTDGNISYETLSGLSGYSPETELLSMFN